jgi:2'-5' RNA ligase
VKGSSVEEAARRKEQEGKEKGKEKETAKAKWTHFVALPVENREVLSSLERLQHQVVASSPALKPGLISKQKFHASLAIVGCADGVALERARDALLACAPELEALFAKQGGAKFKIQGVGHFRNSVLWAGVEDAKTLQAMAAILQKRLKEAGSGVVVQGNDGSEDVELQGHVTLMKTSFFSGNQRAALTKKDKDLGVFTGQWKNHVFGTEIASALQLCAMKTRSTGGVAGGGEGGYVVDGILQLPPSFGRLPSVVSWNHPRHLWCAETRAQPVFSPASTGMQLPLVHVSFHYEANGYVSVKIKVGQVSTDIPAGTVAGEQAGAKPAPARDVQVDAAPVNAALAMAAKAAPATAAKAASATAAKVAPATVAKAAPVTAAKAALATVASPAKISSAQPAQTMKAASTAGSNKAKEPMLAQTTNKAPGIGSKVPVTGSANLSEQGSRVASSAAAGESRSGCGVSALRQEIATAVEVALLATYNYNVHSASGPAWSADLAELAHTEQKVHALLAEKGEVWVTVVYTPPHLDAAMMVDVNIRQNPSRSAAEATKEWAKQIQLGWAAAAQAAGQQ